MHIIGNYLKLIRFLFNFLILFLSNTLKYGNTYTTLNITLK